MGQDHGPDIVDYNHPPQGQPTLWCQWTPNTNGTAIEWDQGEKFYDYIPWLNYLIEQFLVPWNVLLNGQVHWQGEDPGDTGVITVTNNIMSDIIGGVIGELVPSPNMDLVKANLLLLKEKYG